MLAFEYESFYNYIKITNYENKVTFLLKKYHANYKMLFTKRNEIFIWRHLNTQPARFLLNIVKDKNKFKFRKYPTSYLRYH